MCNTPLDFRELSFARYWGQSFFEYFANEHYCFLNLFEYNENYLIAACEEKQKKRFIKRIKLGTLINYWDNLSN
jgi:hypothetical protein